MCILYGGNYQCVLVVELERYQLILLRPFSGDVIKSWVLFQFVWGEGVMFLLLWNHWTGILLPHSSVSSKELNDMVWNVTGIKPDYSKIDCVTEIFINRNTCSLNMFNILYLASRSKYIWKAIWRRKLLFTSLGARMGCHGKLRSWLKQFTVLHPTDEGRLVGR